MEHPTVLIFVEFPNPKFPTTGFLKHLAYPDAELVGFYHLHDDVSIEEVQEEYEEEFMAELQEQAERFEQRGVRTDYELIFDQDRAEARERIAREHDVDAVLLPGGAGTLGNVMIACRHTRNAEEKVANLLNIIDRESLISVELVHIADPDDPEAKEEGKRILREITSILEDEDVPSVRIDREIRTGKDVAFELSQAARNHDLIVMGETQRDLGDRVFGPVGDYILDKQDVPVLVVR